MHVRVENITSDGMTSADEDDYRLKKKSSRSANFFVCFFFIALR